MKGTMHAVQLDHQERLTFHHGSLQWKIFRRSFWDEVAEAMLIAWTGWVRVKVFLIVHRCLKTDVENSKIIREERFTVSRLLFDRGRRKRSSIFG